MHGHAGKGIAGSSNSISSHVLLLLCNCECDLQARHRQTCQQAGDQVKVRRDGKVLSPMLLAACIALVPISRLTAWPTTQGC